MIVYQNHHHHHHHDPVTTATIETKTSASSSSFGGCASAILVQDFVIAPSLMEQDQALQDAHNTTSNTTHHKNQENASSVRDLYGYEEAPPDYAAGGCDKENRSMDDHPILAAGAIAIPKQRHQQKHHARRRSSIDCPSKEYDILMPGEDIPLMKMMTTPSSLATNKKKKTPKHVHFHSDVLVKIILPAKDYLSGSSGEGEQRQEELWYSKQEFQSIRAEMRATLDQAEQHQEQDEQQQEQQDPPNNGTTDEQVSTANSTGPPSSRHRRRLFSFSSNKSRLHRPRLERTTQRKEAVEAQPQKTKQPKRQVAKKEEVEDAEGRADRDNNENDQFCLRGLEHHLKHRRNLYRTSKLRAWSAVFWEQRLQQQQEHQESPFVLEQPSHHDAGMWPIPSSSENPMTVLEAPEERTAHRYHVATQAAMEEAVARGAQDETAIQDYLLDVKQSLRRMSRNIPQ